ncbi:hypothetical protein S83_036890 [Arachis hypogaea]
MTEGTRKRRTVKKKWQTREYDEILPWWKGTQRRAEEASNTKNTARCSDVSWRSSLAAMAEGDVATNMKKVAGNTTGALYHHREPSFNSHISVFHSL